MHGTFSKPARELKPGEAIDIHGRACTIESIALCDDKLIGGAGLKTAAPLRIEFAGDAEPILIHPGAMVRLL